MVIWLVTKSASTLRIAGFGVPGVPCARDMEGATTKHESVSTNHRAAFFAMFICFSIYEILRLNRLAICREAFIIVRGWVAPGFPLTNKSDTSACIPSSLLLIFLLEG